MTFQGNETQFNIAFSINKLNRYQPHEVDFSDYLDVQLMDFTFSGEKGTRPVRREIKTRPCTVDDYTDKFFDLKESN